MSRTIKITKGLDVRLFGEAKPEVVETTVGEYAIKPEDFVALTPKLLVEEGDKVKAGTPIFYAKGEERLKFVSPVSGTIAAVIRGEKRVIKSILKQRLVLLVLKILSFISLKNLICRRILCLKTAKYVLKKCLCHVIGIAICCLYLTVSIVWIYTKCNV